MPPQNPSDAAEQPERIRLPDEIASLSYEEARDALAETVAALEQGQSTLEQSIALWERGNALATRCEQWLAGAKRRLDAAVSGTTPPAADGE